MCVAAKPICKNCDLFILDICPLQFSPKRTLRKMQKPNLPKPIDMCCILWGWDGFPIVSLRVGGLTVRGVRWRKFTNLGHIANTVCFASSPLIHQWHKFRTQSDRWGVDSSTKGQNLLKLKSCCSHPAQPLILLSQGCLALIQLTDKSKVLPPVTNQSQATPSNKRWRQILAPKDKIWRCEANWSFNLIQARRPCINFSHRQKPLSPGITREQATLSNGGGWWKHVRRFLVLA